MINIPVYEPLLGEKELRYVRKCIKSGWVSSLGENIIKFESRFSKFCGVNHGVATSSGTTALHLALVSLGIGMGDEVIVPTLSFVATANAVVYTGARPILIDSEPRTWNIDPEKIEEAITCKTKAVIPVHLYGHPANMSLIMDIAKKHNLFVIEDAAEAHGALYKGRKVGSFGHAACFSFYGNKVITTGEGGMVVTRSSLLNKKMRFLRDHAMSETRRYYHPAVGFNYRLTNMQASLGLAQFEKIDMIISRKREIAFLYNELLHDIKGITLPPEETWAKNIYWMYSILVRNEFGLNRDEIMKRLKGNGIDTRPFFIPMHQLPPYRCKQRFPIADRLASQGVNLPSSPHLTKRQIRYVCEVIKGLFSRERKI